MTTCLIEFCTRLVNRKSRIQQFNVLCRQHQVDAHDSLDKHLPKSLASTRQLFLNTKQGSAWFGDWVRLTEGVFRSRFFLGHPHEIKDAEGNYRPGAIPKEQLDTLLFEKTPAIATPKYPSQAKPHPGCQDPTLTRKKRS